MKPKGIAMIITAISRLIAAIGKLFKKGGAVFLIVSLTSCASMPASISALIPGKPVPGTADILRLAGSLETDIIWQDEDLRWYTMNVSCKTVSNNVVKSVFTDWACQANFQGLRLIEVEGRDKDVDIEVLGVPIPTD